MRTPRSRAALGVAFAAAAALALAAPAAARAQPFSEPTGPATYLEPHLGAWFPQHDDLDALDTGLDLGATFGARFSPNLGVEGELSWTRATGDTAASDLTLETVPFTVSLRGSLPLKPAELHVLAGVGLHMAGLSGDGTVGGFSLRSSEWKAAFGWHLGAGLGFSVWPGTRVGAEVRRTFVEAPFEGFDLRLDALRVAVTLSYDL